MPYPNVIWHRRSDWDVGLKTTFLLVIALLGILANSAILSAILNRRHLGTPINFLFVSLAFTDMATLVISPWIMLCRDIFQSYQLGPVGCKIEGFFVFSFLTVDVLNLASISFIRLMAIIFPHKKSLNRKRVVTVLAANWILGFSAASPLMIFRTYKERQWMDFLEKSCVEGRTILPLYWNVIVPIMIWIPLSFMFGSYVVVFFNFESLTKRSLSQEHPKSVKFKKRAVKIIFAVVVVFIFCRVPFTVVTFWRGVVLQDLTHHAAEDNLETLWLAVNTMMFANAAANPIMYGLTNRCFRKSLQSSYIVGWIMPKPKKVPAEGEPVWTVPKLTPRRLSPSRR